MIRHPRSSPFRPRPCVAALLALAAAVPGWAGALQPAGVQPVEQVDAFVGTQGDHGQLSPAASAPFGMLQLGPDTTPFNHAGYDYAAGLLRGFSHTRGVGVGCGGAGGDLLVRVDYADARPGPQPLDKTSEQAAPGWYRAVYGGDRIEAQLVAAGAAGVARFVLPRDGEAVVSLDLAHAYSRRVAAAWERHEAGDLRGRLSAGTVCDQGVYHLWFASRLLLNGQAPALRLPPDAGQHAQLRLRVRGGDVIELRTGLSSVDAASAARTLDAEVGAQAFQALRAQVRKRWNDELGRIRVQGERERQALFYTQLFRVLQAPARIDDADGRYRAADGIERRVEAGHHRYSGWAVWDNYRTQLPLLALIDPQRSADIAASLAELVLLGRPQWATANEPFISVRTEHTGIALLDFRRKGIGGFDAAAVLAKLAAESAQLPRQSPDQVIESAYDDWAVWQLASDLGQTALAARFRTQALSYRPLWLREFKDIGPDFDVVKARGLYQGTLWQYRWAPVFDLDWLAGEALGHERFDAELERFFAENLFNMTNQPDIQTPFLLAWAGAGERSQRLVRQLLDEPVEHGYSNEGKRARPWHGRSFQLAPVGYADGMDDDAGGMSSWYVWASLGLYPLVVGEPRYLLGLPAFERIEIAPGDGRTLRLRCAGTGAAAGAASAAVELGGRALSGPWLQHADLRQGKELVFHSDGCAAR